MIPLNYHHLYYFWTAARSGSITRAAEALCLSQSALSLQLAGLERACKARLLERGRKGVTLTFEGKLVFERCERIFAEGEELAALVRGGFRAPTALRLGVQPSVSREVVLRLLAFLRRLDAHCRIAVASGGLDSLSERLRRHSLDLLLANEDASVTLGRDFSGRLAGRLPVCFVANKELKRRIRRFPEDLPGVPMLLRPSENPVRKQVDRFLGRARIRCQIEADSDDVDLLRRLAMDGRGVAGFSRLSIEPDLKSGRLRLLHASPLGIQEDVWLISAIRPRSTDALKRLLDAAMNRFRLPGA